MAEPIILPPMGEAQKQSWQALMAVHARLGSGWALIGGQLVHLHCAERGASPPRPTNDIDTVLDVRASPLLHETFTAVLKELGFVPDTTGEGVQHRWRRDRAQIDVLLPDGVGERAAGRPGAGGARTIVSPGTTQALERSEAVMVLIEGELGTVLRPNLLGALVAKAAARAEISVDRAADRHCVDFVVLAGLASAADVRTWSLTNKDRSRLRKMLGYCRSSDEAMAFERAIEYLNRLERVLDR